MKSKRPIILTIGVFDGVHRGHQGLLRKTVALAKSLRGVPAALTFQDHPMHVLQGGPRIPFLLPRPETFKLLKKNGIRWVRVLRFTRSFSRKSPEQFVRWLQSLGNLKGIVVGENFRFGKQAAGNAATLREMGRESGVKVAALKAVKAGGAVVSSSRIRNLLMAGKVEQANALLGRPYAIEGEVVHGRHVGHKIGFPTANLKGIAQFLPKDGVYACAVKVGGKFHRAGMNLGQRPTFRDDDHHRAAEVHLLGYRGGLYGKQMKVYLLNYLRAEKKFGSTSALSRQIRKDLLRVKRASLKGLEKP